LKNTKRCYDNFLTLKITGDRHITSFLFDTRDIIGDLFEMSAKVSSMSFVHNLFANCFISFQVELKLMTQSISPLPVLAPTNPVMMIDDAECFKELAEDMKKLSVAEVLCDVVIICGGDVKLKAHRAVLAARSPVFQAMFTHDMTEKLSGKVKIPDCKPEAMRNFLHFLYHAKLESYDHAAKLLELAEQYQVATLKKMCEAHLITKVTKDNAMEMLDLANLHSSDQLKQKAFDVVRLEILEAFFSVPDDFKNKVKELQKIVDAKLHLDSLVKE